MMKHTMLAGIISSFLGSMTGAVMAADVRACQIEQITGEGVVLRTKPSGQAWTVSLVGVERLNVPATATVVTGPKSRVSLLCDEGTIITVGPDTEIALGDLVGESGPEKNVLLRLLRGIVGIVAPNQTWKRFEVETSLAVASVRSTEWLVESYTGSGTAVLVALGSVSVSANQQDYVLEVGEGITLKEATSNELAPEVPQVKTWGEARISKSRSALGFGWE